MLIGCLNRVASCAKNITRTGAALLGRTHVVLQTQSCAYAKKVVSKGRGKGMSKEELVGPEVCKDAAKLTSYAIGANIFKQGEDPQLKPFEEYPEWLYDLNLGKAKKLNELEPGTMEYWKRLNKENMWRNNRLSKGKKF